MNKMLMKELGFNIPESGCGSTLVEFWDERSKREYEISQLCQQCQDNFFNDANAIIEVLVNHGCLVLCYRMAYKEMVLNGSFPGMIQAVFGHPVTKHLNNQLRVRI